MTNNSDANSINFDFSFTAGISSARMRITLHNLRSNL